MTYLRITGPDLPAEGLPVYDLNGAPGSGNTIEGNTDGSWKFTWYTGTIKGQEKLQTARYYIIASDLSHPEKSTTTSLVLKKPEFYVIASPSSAEFGDYIQLTGISEKGSNNVRFDITDTTGKLVHSYDTTVSASGYFNKGFHVDMVPGEYTITMSSPSVKTLYRNYLTVTPVNSSSPAPAGSATPGLPSTTNPAGPVASGNGTLSISSTPAGATVFLDSVAMGTTPLVLNAITPGNHMVDVKAPGYIASSVQVSVKPGETIVISPVLTKGASPVPLSLVTILAGVFISFALVISCANRRRS
jgi:hypothetical protein